jgi:tRNA-dihydrouridine synthase A
MNDLKQENTGFSYENTVKKNISQGRRLSIAPMMDWTDRHCRVFHRQITKDRLLFF